MMKAKVDTSWKQRLTEAIKQSGLSKAEIAKRAGISAQALSNYNREEQGSLDAMNACKLARALSTTTEWLMSGEGPSNIVAINDPEDLVNKDEYVVIKEYGIEFGAGVFAGESDEPNMAEIEDSIPAVYRRSWFREIGVNPKYCKRFEVVGDSMEPEIHSGDIILVDCSEAARMRIINNDIYAIYYDGNLLCKNLIKDIDGKIIIKSLNPDYGTVTIDSEDMARNFYLVGHVIERSGSLIHRSRR